MRDLEHCDQPKGFFWWHRLVLAITAGRQGGTLSGPPFLLAGGPSFDMSVACTRRLVLTRSSSHVTHTRYPYVWVVSISTGWQSPYISDLSHTHTQLRSGAMGYAREDMLVGSLGCKPGGSSLLCAATYRQGLPYRWKPSTIREAATSPHVSILWALVAHHLSLSRREHLLTTMPPIVAAPTSPSRSLSRATRRVACSPSRSRPHLASLVLSLIHI